MDVFSAIDYGSISARNRLVRSATGEGAAIRDEGRPTKAMEDYYGHLAAGGVGLIVTGHTAISFEGRCSDRMTAFYNPDFVPAFRSVVDACHREGAPVVCQLNHGGRQVNTLHRGIRALCPSPVAVTPGKPAPEPMTEADIMDTIEAFGQAAGWCAEAGFDGVQIHSAHGYLISQFNSPLTNRREDRWGGTAERRREFLRAVLYAMREHTGDEYPILVKQNTEDFHPDGLSLSDATEICRMLDDEGIAAIELSGGIAETIPIAFRAKEVAAKREVVFFEEQCRAIRKAVSCPLILTGGIRSMHTIQMLLEQGVCDAVGMCRPLIRETDLPIAWRENGAYQPKCVSCGRCSQNPARCNFCPLDDA